MAVTNETPEVQAEVTEALGSTDYSTIPGFHVLNGGGMLLGTYETLEDAEAYADAHPRQVGIEVSIVEGKAQD